MRLNSKVVVAGFSALSLWGWATESYATSQALPGITTGIVTSALPPEGIYNIVDVNWGARGPYNGGPEVDLGVGVPIHPLWVTPFQILGGRVFFHEQNVWSQVGIGNGFGHTAANLRGYATTELGTGASWTLGNGFHAAIQEAVYAPANSEVSLRDYWSFQQKFMFGYLTPEWALNVEVLGGPGRDGPLQNVAPANVAFGQPATAGAAWGNLNLTALKRFGKLEFGLVGFGSTDLSSPYTGYKRESQFALGGALGYDFEAVKVVAKLTRDVYQQNEGGYETRAWGILIFPLWRPEAPKAVIAKY